MYRERTIRYDNPSNEPWTRLFRTVVFLNEGEVQDIRKLKLLDPDGAEPITPFVEAFGRKHPDGSAWFVRVDARLTIPPGGATYRLIEGEDSPQAQFEYEPIVVEGINKTRIVSWFEEEGGDPNLIQFVDLLDPSNAADREPIQRAGVQTVRTSGYSSDMRIRFWLDYGSRDFGGTFKLMFSNDKGVNPPGQIRGKVKIIFFGCDAGFKFAKSYGIKLVSAGMIGEEPYSIWEMPFDNLCDSQSWACAGAVNFAGVEDLYKDLKFSPLGFMSRDDFAYSELPEVQMPLNTSQSYRNNLKSTAAAEYNDRQSVARPAWWHMGGSYTPPQSGDQPQFGFFPPKARAVLENADIKAFEVLEAMEMRVMSARPGWINGLYYVDVAEDPQNATYTWFDRPHRTSRNRWGRDRAGFVSGEDGGGKMNGWQGQDAEHYGMVPAFWHGLLSGDIFMRDVFAERSVIAQCYSHSLEIHEGGYFGGWVDKMRTEGRWGRVMWQANLLTDDDSFEDSLKARVFKVYRDWKTNARTFNGKPALYGGWGMSTRRDAILPGKAPIFISWQAGTMAGAYWKLYEKTKLQEAFDICKDLVTLFVNDGWILANESQVGLELVDFAGALNGDPNAFKPKTFVGPAMKKYHDATNPLHFRTAGISLDALVVWPSNLVLAATPELYDSLDAATQERFDKVKEIYDQHWPNIEEHKFGSAYWVKPAPVE